MASLLNSIASSSNQAARDAAALRLSGLRCSALAPSGEEVGIIATADELPAAEAKVKELIAAERERAKAMLRKAELAAHDSGSIDGSALGSILGDDDFTLAE